MTASAYWETLKKTGWLECVPKNDHDWLRDEIEEKFASDPANTWLALVQERYEPGREEPSPLALPSGDPLEMLEGMSHGKFAPICVEMSLDQNRHGFTRVSFLLAGNTFSDVLPDDCWDCLSQACIRPATKRCLVKLVELANKALESTGAKKRFIVLPSDFFCPESVNLVFVSPKTYQRAVRAGLIPDPKNTFGAHLKALRQAKGMSQQKLASAAKVTQPSISSYENGLCEPSLTILRRLAKALGEDSLAKWDFGVA